MRVLFLTSGDRTPSTRFRVLPFLDGLRQDGLECIVAESFPQKYDYIPWFGFRPSQKLKRIVRYGHLLRARIRRFDAIYIDRELFDAPEVELETAFRKLTQRLVLDVDDATFLRYPEKTESLARMADVVIAGNPWLQRQLENWNDHVVVIPTGVRLASFPEKDYSAAGSGCPIIGWMGTPANLEYFAVVAPALRELATRFDFELRLIVPNIDRLNNIDLAGVRVKHVVWTGATEVDELRRIDIGLMPLFPDREWDKYKCPTKLIQYMAIAVPGIASPVGFTGDVVKHGVDGFLAGSTPEWVSAIEKLLASRELRQRMGTAGRQTVARSYCVEANLPILSDTLQGSVDNRQWTA